MKIKDISFKRVVREHDKGVFVGYAQLTLDLGEGLEQTLYGVECVVWDDNGFAVRTPRHQAERNGRWYTDCFLNEEFRKRLGNALLRVPEIARAAEDAATARDEGRETDKDEEIAF